MALTTANSPIYSNPGAHMAFNNQPKTENLIVVDACLIGGQHTEVGTLLRDVPVGDARDLRSSGRVRLASDEELAVPAGRRKAAEAV